MMSVLAGVLHAYVLVLCVGRFSHHSEFLSVYCAALQSSFVFRGCQSIGASILLCLSRTGPLPVRVRA